MVVLDKKYAQKDDILNFLNIVELFLKFNKINFILC